MNKLLKWVSYLFFWMILESSFSIESLVKGIIVASIVLLFSNKIFKNNDVKYLKGQAIWRTIWFLEIVMVEMFKAAFQHIVRIMIGDDTPVILEVELEFKDPFITMLIANAITLTPGTITLKVEGSKLTVLGFAKDSFEEEAIRHTILSRFQKPFVKKQRIRGE
ncbi:MAG: Na+/H+ antiporter subunit E [Tissierellales bacterium]|nr:Na+/H+ antiporter subunit E [Tissierellales bacterium]